MVHSSGYSSNPTQYFTSENYCHFEVKLKMQHRNGGDFLLDIVAENTFVTVNLLLESVIERISKKSHSISSLTISVPQRMLNRNKFSKVT